MTGVLTDASMAAAVLANVPGPHRRSRRAGPGRMVGVLTGASIAAAMRANTPHRIGAFAVPEVVE